MVEWQKYSHKAEIKWTVDGLMPAIDHHTKTKHLLLESYLQDWVETLTGNGKPQRAVRQVTLVDGFCGGGIYRDGDGFWEGSPIRLIRAIEAGWRTVKEQRPYQDLDIAYLFIDAQREHTKCLEHQIREAGYGQLLDSGHQEKLREQLDRFVFDQKALPFRKLFEGTVEQHPATREDYMGVIHQMVLDGDLEIIREDRSRCTSRIFNKDIIRKAEAKQLVLLSDRTSERIPQKRKSSRSSPASRPITNLEISIPEQVNLFSKLEL